MTTPDGPDSNTAQLVQALKDNARRLGLIWQITMATVVDGSDPGAVALQFDGDDTTTPGAISTVGYLSQGERCYVVQVPPAGNYIMGRAVGPYRARITLSTSAANVHFGNIPNNLRSLQVRFKARTISAVHAIGVMVVVNNDTGAQYSTQSVRGNNLTPSAFPAVAGASGIVGLATGTLAPANNYGSGVVDFEGWDQLGQSLSWDYNSGAIGTGAGNQYHDAGSGVYAGIVGRTSLDFSCLGTSFAAGTDFQLYGEPS